MFQKKYAPIYHLDSDGRLGISPMRYGAYEPAFIRREIGGAYNAKRSNLHSPYWSEAFGIHHGFAIVPQFFEKVFVKDVVEAGGISLGKIKEECDRYYDDRKKRLEAQRKKYKPTENELRDLHHRQIAIQFQPADGSALLVPVIFTERTLDDSLVDMGCAIVTGEPQDEVEKVDHDRSLIFLTIDAIMEWIRVEGKSADRLQDIINKKPEKYFEHSFSSVI